MTQPLAVSALNWVAIGFGIAIGVAGAGLIMVNVFAIMRAKREGPKSRRPLIGPPHQMSRRGFFGRMLGLGFGVALLDFGALSLAFLWPSPRGGGFGGKVLVPDMLDDVKAKIGSTRTPYYYAPGRFYLVPYDLTDPGNVYVKAGVVAGGLMALYQRCVHLGCKVPFCVTSQWFECPCHGSKYNRAGEYKAGPAPRSLDRFAMTIDEEQTITVDTTFVITGPPRGTNTTGQEREGPFCVEQIRRAE
ncbi:MAG: ubiquinol-cytochrome c reductase iron-sulfur subunit [bacterium]